MMVNRGVTVGNDAILETYDGFANGSADATFSIWLNERNKYFEPPKGMSAEDRREFLSKFLDRLADQRDNSIYWIRVHENQVKGTIEKNTPYIVALNFRVCDLTDEQKALGIVQPYYQLPPSTANKELENKVDKLLTIVEAQQVQILALSEDDEDFEPERSKGFLGVLSGVVEKSGILQNEQLMMAAISKIGSLLGGLVAPLQQPQQQQFPVLNGMGQNDTKEHFTPEVEPEKIDLQLLDESLSRLSKHFNLNQVMPKLADYLDKNPDKASMVLSIIS